MYNLPMVKPIFAIGRFYVKQRNIMISQNSHSIAPQNMYSF